MLKTDEIIVLAAAAAAVWMIYRSQKPATRAGMGSSGTTSAADWVNEIFSNAGRPYDNGWRYYDNGTAIDPQGNYYHQGQLVYKAA